jgi:hypothetical protein
MLLQKNVLRVQRGQLYGGQCQSAKLVQVVCECVGEMGDETCGAVVQDVIDLSIRSCNALDRNNACYGNPLVSAIGRGDNFTFEQQGDTADLPQIQSITTTPFNPAAYTWGIVLMRLQANLPDTLPGQNMTIVLYGDVTLENDVAEDNPAAVTLTGTPQNAINLRSGPGTDFAALGAAGTPLTLVARNDDASWVQIIAEDEQRAWPRCRWMGC